MILGGARHAIGSVAIEHRLLRMPGVDSSLRKTFDFHIRLHLQHKSAPCRLD